MLSDGDRALSKVEWMDGDSRLAQLAHSVRWFLFAKTSNDWRRARYWRALAGIHRVQMRRRRSSLEHLRSPAVAIPARRGLVAVAPRPARRVDTVFAPVRGLRAPFPPARGRPSLFESRAPP